jgi:hypothetical protein
MPGQTVRAPALSIVIPTVADTAALEETLVSVLENRPPDCEIVVPIACGYDDPWNIRDEVTFVEAPRGARLVGCTNLGIASSRGEIIHVLAAGWKATPGWTDRPLERFAADDIAAVVPAVVTSDEPARVGEVGVRTSRGGRRMAGAAPRPDGTALAVGTSPLLEAGFWRAEVLRMAGPGFSTSCGDAFADADMAAAVGCLPMPVVYEAESRVIRGPGRRQPRSFTAGLHAERLFWRSLGRGSKVGACAAIAAHAFEVVRDAVVRLPLGTLPMLAGRGVALVEFGSTLARLRQLRQLRDLPAADEPGQTLRIDTPHESLARPRGRHVPAAPLKRSA